VKVNNVPGEFAFPALRIFASENGRFSWEVTRMVYFSLEEAREFEGKDAKWPVQILENGEIYIAAPEEMV
jgi:hypothetical protein